MDNYQIRQLEAAGIRHGARIEATLVRYVPAAEYLSETWRRDGLLRNRHPWAAVDRATGFLGLLLITISAFSIMSGVRTAFGALLSFLGPLLFFTGSGVSPIGTWLRPILFSDVDRPFQPHRAMIPQLTPHYRAAEFSLWTVVLSLAFLTVFWLAAREMRLGAFGVNTHFSDLFPKLVGQRRKGAGTEPLGARSGTRRGKPFSSFRFRGQLHHRRRLTRALSWSVALGVVLLVAVYGFQKLGYGSSIPGALLLVFSITGPGLVAVVLANRWAPRDALLSRLPVAPGRVALRRLVVLGFCCVLFAGPLPWLLGHISVLTPNSWQSSHGGARFSREDAFFLERFGGVPVLRATAPTLVVGDRLSGQLHCHDLEGASRPSRVQKRSGGWTTEGDFLPRGKHLSYLFKSSFTGQELPVGAQIREGACSFEVTRLLVSRTDVNAFLARSGVAGWGPVPGPRHLLSVLVHTGIGLLVLAVALLCHSQRMLWMVGNMVILLNLSLGRIVWSRLMDSGTDPARWWVPSVGIVLVAILLLWLYRRLKRRIEQGFEGQFQMLEAAET